MLFDELKGPNKGMMIGFHLDNFSIDELLLLVEVHSYEVYKKQFTLMTALMQQAADLHASQMDVMGERLEQWVEQNK